MIPPETIAAVRAEGRRRRGLTRIERQRSELAAVMDTGMLSDADVQVLYAAYVGARDEPVELSR